MNIAMQIIMALVASLATIAVFTRRQTSRFYAAVVSAGAMIYFQVVAMTFNNYEAVIAATVCSCVAGWFGGHYLVNRSNQGGGK